MGRLKRTQNFDVRQIITNFIKENPSIKNYHFPKSIQNATLISKTRLEAGKCSFNGSIIIKKDNNYIHVVDSLENTEIINVFRMSRQPSTASSLCAKKITKDGECRGDAIEIITQYEDPRLFSFKDELYVSATFLHYISGNLTTKIKILKLSNHFKILESRLIEVGKNSLSNPEWEKNWLFFAHMDKLVFIYTLCPFVVYSADGQLIQYQEWSWPHDHIRGGTPPILVNNNYYMFAHAKSWNGVIRIVVIQFDLSLTITRMSPILSNLDCFEIVYPSGCIFVGEENRFYVTCGIEDREQYILFFSKLEIDEMLQAI